MDIRPRDTCTALSTKSVMVSIHLRKTSMTTNHRVQFASSSHVPQHLWCPHGMIVHLAGPRSIMGTWWLSTTTTRSNVTSYVLTRMRSMSPVLRPTRMVPYCILWKEYVAHSHATRMSPEENWHALCAPSDRRPPLYSIRDLEDGACDLISKAPVLNTT